MKTYRMCRLTCLLAALMMFQISPAWSGMQIEIVDPLFFERQHDVIFPWADAKLVTFEFESVAGIPGGKQSAKELHDLFLSKIQGLPGGAILTYLTPEGQRIENYRFTARKAAQQQQAQMSLWGRMFPDKSGASLINVRLELIAPPKGIQAGLKSQIMMQGGEQPIHGFISDEVSQTRIDFQTVEESNIGALADFLSGLAFYYKGAKNDSDRTKQLLRTAIERLGQYIDKTQQRVDYSAASAANVYIARAYYHLSRLESSDRQRHLANAEQHGRLAVKLNPYESDPYTALAVIRTARSQNDPSIVELLTKAVAHAPGSLTSNSNLALVKSVTGQLDGAIHRLEQVEYLQQQEQKPIYKELGTLQDKLRTIKRGRLAP